MATEHGERVKLLGYAMGDHAESDNGGSIANIADQAGELVVGAAATINLLDRVDEATLAVGRELDEVLSSYTSIQEAALNMVRSGQELANDVEVTHDHIVHAVQETASQTASEGMLSSLRATTRLDDALAKGSETQVNLLVILNLVRRLQTTIEEVRQQFGVVREKTVNAGETATVAQEAAEDSKQAALISRDRLIEYGDSL